MILGIVRSGLALATAAALVSAPAKAADMEKATIAIPVESISFAPVYVAQSLDLWKKAGIDVSVKLVRGIGATNALIAKSVEFSNGSGATVIRGNVRHRGLIAIMTTVTRPTFELVLRKDVVEKLGVKESATLAERAKALKGLSIGLSGLNNISHTFLNYSLSKGGLKQQDIRIVNMAPPSMYAALKKGDIDGFETATPWTFAPVDAGDAVNWISGLRVDMPELGNMANTVLIARQGYCEENASICRKVVKGYQGALRYIHEEPQATLKILQKQFPKLKPALLRQAFERMVLVATSKADGKFPEGGLANAAQFMIAAGHLKKSDAPKSFDSMYTERYLTDAPGN
jgi:NitT/TauT family transport system substrate-binding protein